MPRNIDDILNFRTDLSPFLVHLTKASGQMTARACLENIVNDRELTVSCNMISDARFGTFTNHMNEETKCRFFGAICFTETPLNEVHGMLEIAYRQVNLEPYDLVFLKSRLKQRGVGPVFYFNNEFRDKDEVVAAICDLIPNNPQAAEKLLPMISNFGYRITPPAAAVQQGRVDFLWEREWRLPSVASPLDFTEEDVFVGLCPHNEIDHFEGLFPHVGFIDPMRNMKWYATKLIDARQRLDLKSSVV
jgi:hypothetical protein